MDYKFGYAADKKRMAGRLFPELVALQNLADTDAGGSNPSTPQNLLQIVGRFYFVAHRERAAFLAIADRFFALKLSARAFPPFNPPRRPSATAAGFFVPLPFVLCATIPAAIWFMSLGMRHYA